jgi:hypothetical protein
MLELLIGAVVGVVFVLGAGRLIYLQGMLQSARKVNDHLVKERDDLVAAIRQTNENNKTLLAREQAILNKPFHIQLDEPQLQNLAALLGPYLAVTVTDGKITKPN